jgi:hypothetical protein
MKKAKKSAIIAALIGSARSLLGMPSGRESPDYITWRQDVEAFLERIDASRLASFKRLAFGGWASLYDAPDHEVQEGFTHDVRWTIALLESVKNDIERYDEDDALPQAPQPPGTLAHVVAICRNFPRAARQLQQRYASRPGIEQSDEYDVQDVLHAFLLLHFADVRTEEWTPSYAGSSARIDIVLPAERIVIEVKRTRDGLATKKCKEELAIDIDHYRIQKDCGTLVCFVFDPDHRIKNPVGFEKDLEGQRTDTLHVRVVVAPHG